VLKQNTKLRIAVNCWVLRNKKPDGIGYYTINTISRIIRSHPEVDFLLLCDKNFTESYFDFPNTSKYYIFPALRHPVLYVLYMELILPFFLKKHKPDVFLSPDGFLSLISSCPQIPVIHDINFEHYPKDLKLKNRLYYRFFFKRFARKADRIVTVSAFSKQDIVNWYKIDPNKIDIVYNSFNAQFHPLDKVTIDAVRNKWSNGKQYFFFVGSMHPRKNIKRLIVAFNLFKQQTHSDCCLLLAGSILWDQSELENVYNNSSYKTAIIFTGRVSDSELVDLLGGALALSFVPIFEGFGVPIIEAMQSGVPVICSNVTSMPEVAGDAALLVDPLNELDIAGAMQKIYTDMALQQKLIQLGNIQKEKFSWDNSADMLWQTLIKVITQ
jgi:glycosyltransferase involved in cell wall biosynthesis